MLLIRVLVVDDSILMRTILTDVINVPGEITVVGTARNGLEGVEMAKKLSPDVITMDVEMPKMDGITAVRAIMKEKPTPVIMLSAMTQQGARETMSALSAGAFDFVPKPSGSISLDIDKVREPLLEKIRAACRVDRDKLRCLTGDLPEKAKPMKANAVKARKLVVIGSSTGGPGALERVLTRLPGDLKAGILVVQHMPAGFTRSLADRLNRISEIDIKEAEEGDAILEGRALIAPGNYHMLIRKGLSHLITLNQEPPVHAVRPAADVTMKSATKAFGDQIVGVILTGMGSDGAFGLKDIKDHGGRTIACDQKTSVIFGMPRAAIELGCVDRVAPLGDIANEIVDMVKGY
ncbi:protein-glutamate methylesterase/protein-glutamine glutaminase [Methanocella arvoryzae]|uniref:Protein-glutamate methylesterase/protein-glutamine glutaminase n=1 Tax=Methanocella arvoryzae (strain DSM 22066 / NBRC 105507 / MRE50) TaxID=351160 RepID=Q0W7Z3_METAR|nr:chemotaxis methylesterase [Methanocella arvoryzae MRE50]